MSTTSPQPDKEASVHARYSQAAQEHEDCLCVASPYAENHLQAIPEEILTVDYGCGDPTPYVRPGDTVVDLGSGSGKVCYILAQIVGPEGRVIGVDCNQQMLALARRHRESIARRLGYDNVEFRCGMIQDLQLDLDRLIEQSNGQPIAGPEDWLRLRDVQQRLRQEQPMIADESVDCVVSNCVLNLVRPEDRNQLFSEIFRVLKRGGRVAISDIIADEDVPERLQRDPKLWSGCISGAHREDLFLKAFEDAGFHGIEIVQRQQDPWQVVEGIEFRTCTVLAYKGKQGPCLERNQAVIYRGPFRRVEDDDKHVFVRGQRTAICDKMFHLLAREPYEGMFEPVEPREPVPPKEAVPFDCNRERERHPRESKGKEFNLTVVTGEPCCGPEGDCG